MKKAPVIIAGFAALVIVLLHPQKSEAHMLSSLGASGSPIGVTGTMQPTSMALLTGNGVLMSNCFAPFRPQVRFCWDNTYFYVESDGYPNRALMSNLMVGITSWQQQIPLPASYFASTTNPEKDTNSLGYNQPNFWKLPLAPVAASSSIPLSTNFQRGAVAIGIDGIPIFNPRNNTGRYSYAIGELDAYGGHCGMADDYHYHVAPLHLQSVVGATNPVAWALDGYPIYCYLEPDGSAVQPLDADGGHTNVSGSYHYHAIGSSATGPQEPYLMNAIHGSVVNLGGQIDGQAEVGSMRANGTGGYNAKPISGASIVAFVNPAGLSTNAQGDFVQDASAVPSDDQFVMTYSLAGTNYDCCWRLNRQANPKTLRITWRAPGTNGSGQVTGPVITTTTTYTNANNRITAYPPALLSMLRLPDTGQTNSSGATFGQDADYSILPPSFQDHGDGTVTDRVTGLMWQKVDAGEFTWDVAVSNATNATTGGYTDWRLPTPTELFSIFDHKTNPAVNALCFPDNPAGAASYWWTTDIYGTNSSLVWVANSGGGLGPKSKTQTTTHARYVRGGKPSNGHNYCNNGDGTVTDLDTGLMWQQVPATAATWGVALSNAESLSLGGFTDWRLPNIKELQTLTDYTLATATTAASAKACVNRVLFPTNTTPATAYWSSTPKSPVSDNQAWLLELGINTSSSPSRNYQGIISYETMSTAHPYFAVRGPDQIFSAGAVPTTINGVEVSWIATPGQTYLIHYSTNLANASWTYLGTVRCNWTTGYFTDTDAAHATNKNGFYRLSSSP